MGDLFRTVFKGPARAGCGQCGVLVEDVLPESASARARKHTRETGHVTAVRYAHTTEYQPDTRGGSDG